MNVDRRIRWYQRPLHEYLVGTPAARAIEIAHRRWGKDEIALAVTCELAHRRIGSYWHCLPEYAQGRKALWTAVNAHTGRRRIDEAFPPEIVESRNEQEMFLRLKNGSTWQIIGSDRYDATVGAGPAGIVYSEWALADPSAWAYHRPMVEENDGWALFITTPRGRNHAHAMYQMALNDPHWFAEISTARDTGVLTESQLASAMGEYAALYGDDVGSAQFEQEYMCSFNAAILGAYFGREMAQADADGRICRIDVDPTRPVHTAWDLGAARNNPIWCFQVIDGQVRVVDFYRPASDDIEEWCAWLDERGYHGTDYVPHDIAATDWGAKRTRVDTMRLLGRTPRRIPAVSVEDGRQAARETIKKATFDAERCALGIEGLRNYRREWDQELKVYRENPVKDWSEHIGSAFRYLGLAWRDIRATEREQEPPISPYMIPEKGITFAEAVKLNAKRREARGSARI